MQDIEVDSSQCLETCSGLLVTSYDQQEIQNENAFFNSFILKLSNYFEKDMYRKDFPIKFDGLFEHNISSLVHMSSFKNL